MTDRRRRSTVVGIVVTLVGVGLLALSAFVPGWPADLFINLGSACLLAIPLVWVERQLERSEQQTQKAVGDLRAEVSARNAEVRQSIADIAARVAQADADRDEERRRQVDAVGEAPSREGIGDVLEFSVREKAVSDRGLRVRVVPGLRVYVRFSCVGKDLHVTVERVDGEPVAPALIWAEDETITGLLLRLSEVLDAASLHPGRSFDGGRPMMIALSTALRTARSVKARFQVIEDVSAAIEVCGDQWMICDWGICGWHDEASQPYPIEAHRLKEGDWYRHMGEKDWVDMEQFRYALETARLLRAGGHLSG